MAKTLSWAAFAAISNGTRIFNHGYDQCVALANHYHEGVLGKSFVAISGAAEWWTRYWALPALHNTYVQSRTPIAGAVVVWQASAANGWFGHIGVVLEVFPDGSFTSFEQNYYPGGSRWSARYRRAVNSTVLGFLVPRENPATPPAPDPIPEPKRRKVKTMLGLTITDGQGRYGTAGKKYFATYDGRTFIKLTQADANPISEHLGEAFANVSYDAWESYLNTAEVVA